MKKIWIVIFITLFLLCGCSTVRTVYVYPELPEYNVVIPDKPVLEKIESNVPIEVNRNTIKLITYSQQLEISLMNFRDFYNGLYERWRNENAET